MAALGKEALLKVAPSKRERIQIGPLGGEVVMRQLSMRERLKASARFAATDEKDTESVYRAALAQAVMSLCNDDGSPMFTDEEIDPAVESMFELASAAIEDLIAACSRLQGIGKGDIKESLGNSDEIPIASSSSGSPGISDTQQRKVSLSA